MTDSTRANALLLDAAVEWLTQNGWPFPAGTYSTMSNPFLAEAERAFRCAAAALKDYWTTADVPPVEPAAIPPPLSPAELERRRITPAVRRRIIERDGPWCVACGWPHKPGGAEDGVGLQIDHMLPISRGGTSDDDNLTVLCGPCNRSKGTSDLAEFYERRYDKLMRDASSAMRGVK